jgi:hypothetical protein
VIGVIVLGGGINRYLCCVSFYKSGCDLLFRVLRRSIIGAEGFHYRVRDGIVCFTLAITARHIGRYGCEGRFFA